MSHFSTLNTPITNRELLITCLKAKGLEVQYNAKIRGYQGTLSDRMYDIVGCTEGLGMAHDLGYYWGPGLNGVPAFCMDFHSDTETYTIYCGVIGDYLAKKALEQSSANSQRGLAGANVKVLAGNRN